MSAEVKPSPTGYHSLTPHLVVKDAISAIAFYEKAFGATNFGTMLCPQTNKVMHAQLQIGDSKLMLAEEFPDYGCLGPLSIGGTPVTIHLYVEDVDATYAQAVEAGATPTMPVMDMFWGDRYGKLKDPFGHEWSVATHIANLTREEMAERMAESFATAAV